MRNVLVAAAGLFLALLIFLPAGSSAAQAHLVATTGVPVKLYGSTTVRAPSGLLVATPLDQAPTLTIDSNALEITRVRITSSYASVAGQEALGERRLESETIEATGAKLLRLDPDGHLIVDGAGVTLFSEQTAPTDEPPARLWTEAVGQLGVLLVPTDVGPPMPAPRAGQLDSGGKAPGIASLAAGTYIADTRQGSAEIESAARIVLFGGSLSLSGPNAQTIESGRTARTDAPGSLFIPGAQGGTWNGPGTHVEERIEYVVIRPESDAGVSLQGGRLRLYADDFLVDHRGFFGFPWAQGSVETANETLPLGGEQLILGGSLRLRPIGFHLDDAPSLTLLGDGQAQYVQVGVAKRTLANAEAAAVAGATTAGLGLLAALVYYWPAVKYAASAALLPLYARVPKEDTLQHKGRELLYELIKGEPGISTNKLAKDVPFGWSTLTYHLRVLERNEAIVSVRDGRYKRFFDRRSGRYSNGRKFILAVLKNDATLQIARRIRDAPGASQKDVAGQFQLSPSSVHWHVQRLLEAGLVQKVRDAHNVRYYPGDAWAHVTMEDLQALEARPRSPLLAPPPAATAAGATPAA